MINLNKEQINALSSLIFEELSNIQKSKKEELLKTILNDSNFINSYNKLKEEYKKAEKLSEEAYKNLKQANRIENEAYKEFTKYYPITFDSRSTLQRAATSYVNFTINKEFPITKTTIKKEVALSSIDATTIEDIKNKILNYYK